jgi:Protein of unknown function (DUF615)
MPRPPTQETRPPRTAIPTADAPLTPSKSQRKRDAHALQALGGQLVALSAAQLPGLISRRRCTRPWSQRSGCARTGLGHGRCSLSAS